MWIARLVFLDDLGFEEGDTAGPRALRSWLEGGVEARPANVRLAVTANRRAIVSRHMSEQDDPINPRDAVDDQAGAGRPVRPVHRLPQLQQDDYLASSAGCGGLWSGLGRGDALEWSRRGGRSGASPGTTSRAGRAPGASSEPSALRR
jgi:predicted AAA+ superfamily ATPase